MSDLIERIESCGFECEAGPLTMSRDWHTLRARVAELEAERDATRSQVHTLELQLASALSERDGYRQRTERERP